MHHTNIHRVRCELTAHKSKLGLRNVLRRRSSPPSYSLPKKEDHHCGNERTTATAEDKAQRTRPECTADIITMRKECRQRFAEWNGNEYYVASTSRCCGGKECATLEAALLNQPQFIALD